MMKCGIVQASSGTEIKENIDTLKKYVAEAKEKASCKET